MTTEQNYRTYTANLAALADINSNILAIFTKHGFKAPSGPNAFEETAAAIAKKDKADGKKLQTLSAEWQKTFKIVQSFTAKDLGINEGAEPIDKALIIAATAHSYIFSLGSDVTERTENDILDAAQNYAKSIGISEDEFVEQSSSISFISSSGQSNEKTNAYLKKITAKDVDLRNAVMDIILKIRPKYTNKDNTMKESWIPKTIAESAKAAFISTAKTAKKKGLPSFVFEGKTYRISVIKEGVVDTIKAKIKAAIDALTIQDVEKNKEELEDILNQIQTVNDSSQVIEASQKLSTKTLQHLARLEIPGISKRNIEMLLSTVAAGRSLSTQHKTMLRRLLPKLIALAAEASNATLDKVPDGEVLVELDLDYTGNLPDVIKELKAAYPQIDIKAVAGKGTNGSALATYVGKAEDIKALLKDRYSMTDEEAEDTIAG